MPPNNSRINRHIHEKQTPLRKDNFTAHTVSSTERMAGIGTLPKSCIECNATCLETLVERCSELDCNGRLDARHLRNCVDFKMSSGNRMPENFQTLTPILKIPLTDTLNLPLSQQVRKVHAIEVLVKNEPYRGQQSEQEESKPCGFFEAQFFRCMEAYGAKLGRKYCDLEHRDYQECLTGDKQRKRTQAIRNERRKKFLKGELPAAFLADHPQPGEYKADYFSHNRVH
ncbi:hypothetical protein Tcan_10284 [Toxocara canis]|uniref:Uncharacterized protein n=1 Tax=Toxocara canis TaxID=6265 RepID=A0A0B2UNT2_TOXCA|nr:hypothetical protein Tcan_10284 [Toxocara canis]